MSHPLETTIDFFNYADSYFKACKLLINETGHGKYAKKHSDLKGKVFRIGPIFRNLGLATELTFKTALLLSGYSKDEVKNLGHDLIELQDHVRKTRDLKFAEEAAFKEATIIGPPDGMLQRMESSGKEPQTWFNLATHIRSLNNNYFVFELTRGTKSNERFRTRYPSTDHAYREVCVEAVMAGLDVLLNELQTELNDSIQSR